MKKALSLILILIFCMNLTVTGFAIDKQDTLQNLGQNINEKSILVDTPEEYEEFQQAIRKGGIVDSFQKKVVDGVIFLTIKLSNDLMFTFKVTDHAAKNITERFGGDYSRVANALFDGTIYNDLKYGGYIASKGSDAVSFTEDYVIKTVMDKVIPYTKVLLGQWEKISSSHNFFGF